MEQIGHIRYTFPLESCRAPLPTRPAIAQRAGARYLLFTHIIPPLPMRALEGPFLGRSREIFSGEVRVGHDGDFLSLPAGGTQITRTNRLAIFQ